MSQLKRKSHADEKCSIKKSKITDNSSLNEEINKLINSVTKEEPFGKVVVVVPFADTPFVTLQNSLSLYNMNVDIKRDPVKLKKFVLTIDEVPQATGTFNNLAEARKELAEQVLENFKHFCFLITMKDGDVNVTKENLTSKEGETSTPKKIQTDLNSIAHKMMMKMGWSGGGLGAQEQGNVEHVSVTENIEREGLGNNTNLLKTVRKKLEDFANSSDVLTLIFNTDFTSPERAAIHKIARSLNLKSKSTGGKNERKLKVFRKFSRIDIVRELLKIGGEDGLHKLHIPKNYTHLWKD